MRHNTYAHQHAYGGEEGRRRKGDRLGGRQAGKETIPDSCRFFCE